MADISSYLKKILEAIYGEEVRGSIHDALSAMNVESNKAMEFASTAQDSAQASAEQAKQSETTAITKAAESLSSANAAKLSEDNAKASETLARTKADEAIAVAEAAQTSETNAANSEAAASQKASDAEVSKNAAAISEANALASEQRAKDIRDAMEVLGAQAKSDKDAAEAAKDAAKASQDAAAISASGAATSANTAENAKVGAEAAKTVAETARDEAETAQEAAEAAQAAAEASETAAKTSEDNAAESAETAKQYSGKPAIVDETTKTWLIWNADKGEYEDTGLTSEIAGPTGNGIASIELTSGSHLPGETDIYTITMTDGTTKDVPVFQGKNGNGVGDLIGEEFDLLLPVADWSNGELTIFDSRLLASRRYKYLISAYDDSLVEVRECKVEMKDITVNGQISFTADIDPINPITLNVLRLEVGANQSP